ncbi:carboxypeptidase-like regulatory domain-containing protein [Petrimonas sp.]|uniref:carboxypeptidase-like regulatory domain-containing protein n=1 Tax=Petrimonas sp. TaxID=2023866 RepID=UPI002FCA707A
MKTILVLIATVLLSVSVYAEDNKNDKNVKNTAVTEAVRKVNTVDISGSVVDNKSNESLAGAAIFIDGNKYYSDLDGNFSVSDLKPGKHTVRVELISYQPSEMQVDLQKDKEINIGLIQE